MTRSSHTSDQALHHSRQIAAELAAEAVDPAADLVMADRVALAALALAVDVEASRQAGVEPVAGVRDVLTERLTVIEAATRRESG